MAARYPLDAPAPVMSRSLARSLALVRVSRDDPPPSETQVRAALAADRQGLGLPAAEVEYRVAGPYAVEVGGRAMDEYVVWEA